jgi:hypothetical protein
MMAISDAAAHADTSGQAGDRGPHRFEVVAAVVLGLAAFASAWSVYQAVRWDGRQIFRLAEASMAARRAAEQAVFANQLRTVDTLLFAEYVKAVGEGKPQLANFLLQRFRPDMKAVTEAWLATRPQENPAAPPTPFAMPEYALAADKDATQWRAEEGQALAEARAANTIADTYRLLTVLYSLVLFLSGIATAFQQHRVKMVVLALAVMLMIVTAARMVFLPLAAA